MIAVDSNLLIYAHREDSEFHTQALEAVLNLAHGDAPWAIPWSCIHEFLAIVTHPRIYRPPTPTETAIAAIRAWFKSPSCRLLSEGPGYDDVLFSLLEKSKVKGPMIHDGRIAAMCIHHGVKEMWTADRDFSRFGGLRVRNPLME